MLDRIKERAIDISRTASSSDIIYSVLRDEIISGHLKAGDSIRQEHIAQLFNVSRIPVREALKKLEAQGLIKSERYKGAVVSSLCFDEIKEIFEIRATLEPLIIRYSVPNMTQDTLTEAWRLCEAFRDEEDTEKWGEWNRKYHEMLYREAQRPYHLKVIGEAIDRVDAYIRAQLVLSKGMEIANTEHEAILKACNDGDADLAAQLTYDHIMGSFHSLTSYMNNQQAYGTGKSAENRED